MPEIISTEGPPTDDTGAVVTPPGTVTIQAVTSSWDYEQNNGSPASGLVYQSSSGKTLTFNKIDHNSADRTTFFTQLAPTDTITANGVTWNVLSVSAVGNTYVVGVAPGAAAPPYGVSTFSFNIVAAGTGALFPMFNPIVPPPAIGQGGGPPPTFPPPTPPPIGLIPAGILAGPAIAAAAVPPSVAGVVQPQYKTGSATSPTAASWFPQFTTAPYAGFPNQPPNGVPLVFSNISTNPSFSGGTWHPVAVPFTATTAVITYPLSLMADTGNGGGGGSDEFVPASLMRAKRRRNNVNQVHQ